MNKYTINMSDDDRKDWFIHNYMLEWVKHHHPQVETEAIEQYNLLLNEAEQDKEQVAG